MKKIGIPRSLFYYYYYPLWFTFFKELGCEVRLSTETNKKIVQNGIYSTVDEVCFPIKIYFGHVEQLIKKVDYIFCPRIVSIEPKAYICPKFMGLPDMIKSTFKNKVNLIAPIITIKKDCEREHKKIFLEMAIKLGYDKRNAHVAWNSALNKQLEYNKLLEREIQPVEGLKCLMDDYTMPKNRTLPKVAILGHGYNLYDKYISMDLISKVEKQGFKVVTPDMVSTELIDKYTSKLRKRIFWSLGKKIIGALFNYLDNCNVIGIIYIASFGCGPDSLIGHLAEMYIRNSKMPFMMITVDEHTGEAGINTRIEAFLDMLKSIPVMNENAL